MTLLTQQLEQSKMYIRELLDAVAEHQLGNSEVLGMKLDELNAILGGFVDVRDQERELQCRIERVTVRQLCEVRVAFNLPTPALQAMSGHRLMTLTVAKVFEPCTGTTDAFSFHIHHDGQGKVVNVDC